MLKIKSSSNRGFTLIELVVAMAIIAILVSAGLSSFFSSQVKGRDGRRKADLNQLSKALEMYYNDHGSYPSSSNGLIVGCGEGGSQNCNWDDGPFTDSKGTIYMQKLPKDPVSTRQYFYYSDNLSYALYCWLENNQDASIIVPSRTTNCAVSGNQSCNFGIASPNTTP